MASVSIESWNSTVAAVATLGTLPEKGTWFDREYATGMMQIFQGIADYQGIVAERTTDKDLKSHAERIGKEAERNVRLLTGWIESFDKRQQADAPASA